MKSFAVLGFGKSGKSSVMFLLNEGANVFISESDERKREELNKLKEKYFDQVDFEIGDHSEKVLLNDILVLSPGIALNEKLLTKCKELKKEVISELELGYRFIAPKKIIAITGTNGKTTTTTLVAEICKAYGERTICCGNIGTPLTSFVDEIDNNTTVVVEVSSYQLEHVIDFRANAATVLNITPDHLARHKSITEYAKAKAKIFENQRKDDLAVLNKDCEYNNILEQKIHSKKIFFDAKNKAEIFFKDGKIFFPEINWEFSTKELKILGMHNIENVMAAAALTKDYVKRNPKIIDDVLMKFAGVEHRLEFIRDYKGVSFINDSKSTNVDSTFVALKSFDRPIILFMGGREKEGPYAPLVSLIKERVKLIIAYGEGRQRIYDELKDFVNIDVVNTVDDGLDVVLGKMNENDVVLFSPACASFDQFENFEHRGKYFKELVNKL